MNIQTHGWKYFPQIDSINLNLLSEAQELQTNIELSTISRGKKNFLVSDQWKISPIRCPTSCIRGKNS